MTRNRVVVLGGAGAMGRITVRDLLRTGRGLEIVVADTHPAPVRELGVRCLETDVTDPASLRRALDGAFAAIASLPYSFNVQVMRGALGCGVHYIDLGGLFHLTRQQLALAGDFERAGLVGLLGMGSAPGILNVLAVRAARGMERVREIHCMVGAADHTRYRGGAPLEFGYAADTLLDEFAKESAVFRAGRWQMVPALDPGERVRARFPAPVGTRALDTTLHSEVATLPLAFADRGVREVTFRQSFEPEFADRLRFLAELGMLDTTPLDGATGLSPRSVLLGLLRRFPPQERQGPLQRYEILRTLVRGTRRGRGVTFVADCHAGPRAGWGTGPDIDTGAPPSIAVQLLHSGEMPLRPGVWAPESLVPVEPFLRELERRGMRVRVHSRR